MRTDFPERYRRQGGISEPTGSFVIPHNKITDYKYVILISSVMDWEHVSITMLDYRKNKHGKTVKRCLTWEEMCYIKDLFFKEEEAVMQLHPPKSDYVNNHPYCLHLWRPMKVEIPLPPSIMVGINN